MAVGQAIGRCNEIPSRKITDDRRQMTVDRSQLKKGKKRTTVSSNTRSWFQERWERKEGEVCPRGGGGGGGGKRPDRGGACSARHGLRMVRQELEETELEGRTTPDGSGLAQQDLVRLASRLTSVE